jgi:cytochrome c551
MRLAPVFTWPTLCVALLVMPAAASGLRWGLNGISAQKVDLGPAGNGRRIFLQYNCYGCHGDKGAGGEGRDLQGASKSLVENRVLQGGALGMRSFKQYLTKSDADNVAAYIATIGTPSEPTWVDWWKAHPGQTAAAK